MPPTFKKKYFGIIFLLLLLIYLLLSCYFSPSYLSNRKLGSASVKIKMTKLTKLLLLIEMAYVYTVALVFAVTLNIVVPDLPRNFASHVLQKIEEL